MSPILLLGGVSALLVLGLSSCNGAQGGNSAPVKKPSRQGAAIDHEAIIARDRVKFGFPREIRFHPKGEVIAVATEGLVEIRGGSSLKFLYALAEGEKKPDWANSLDFSPDGKHLVVDSAEDPESPRRRGLAIWNWRTRRMVRRVSDGREREMNWIRYSPDGRWIASASGSGDYSVRVWDAKKGTLVKVLDGFPKERSAGSVTRVEFSPDGRFLAASPLMYQGGFIRVWRTDNWQVERDLTISDAESFEGVVFSPDMSMLYSTAKTHLVGWAVSNWQSKVNYKPEYRHYGWKSRDITVSRNGKLLALGTQSEGIVRLLRIKDFREVSVRVFPQGAASHISGLHFSSDSKRLAVAGSNGCAILDVEKAMR